MGWMARISERRSLRRAVATPCQAVRERGFRLIGARALDLSPSGMLLEGSADGTDAEVGEEVLVSFVVPGTRQWIDAEANVSRIVRGRRAGDGGLALGLAFRSLDAVSRAILEASLEGRPPPIPRRRLRMDYARTVLAIAAV